MTTVSGTISTAVGNPLPARGTAHVRVVDASLADAPSITVAEAHLPLTPGYDALPFKLDVDNVDPRARYVLQVHLDLSDNGAIEVGDFVTTQSYPVLTYGAPDTRDVAVHRVD